MTVYLKVTTDLSAYYRRYLKYMKKFLKQIYDYFNNIFSKYLCGFRKGHSTQHCLLYMLEFLRKALDKGMYTGIFLADVTKAFDSISHDLLVAKLNSYGSSTLSLRMINDYLNDRKQRTRINNCFSSWCPTRFHFRAITFQYQ